MADILQMTFSNSFIVEELLYADSICSQVSHE